MKFCVASLCLLLIVSCNKEDWSVPQTLPVLFEQPVNKLGISHPSNFNTCYGVFNFRPDRTWSWAKAKVNGELQHGVARMSVSSSDSTIYRLRILFLDYESCNGLFQIRYDDVPVFYSKTSSRLYY